MQIECKCGEIVKIKIGEKQKHCRCGNVHYPVFKYDKRGNTIELLKSYFWGENQNAY